MALIPNCDTPPGGGNTGLVKEIGYR